VAVPLQLSEQSDLALPQIRVVASDGTVFPLALLQLFCIPPDFSWLVPPDESSLADRKNSSFFLRNRSHLPQFVPPLHLSTTGVRISSDVPRSGVSFVFSPSPPPRFQRLLALTPIRPVAFSNSKYSSPLTPSVCFLIDRLYPKDCLLPFRRDAPRGILSTSLIDPGAFDPQRIRTWKLVTL